MCVYAKLSNIDPYAWLTKFTNANVRILCTYAIVTMQIKCKNSHLRIFPRLHKGIFRIPSGGQLHVCAETVVPRGYIPQNDLYKKKVWSHQVKQLE